VLLLGDAGEPITSRMIQRWIERVERRAGVDVGGRVHIFRHSFCSHLAIKGAPARAVQELAGHADLTTTMRYMHFSPAARASAIQLLNSRPDDARTAVEAARVDQGFGEILAKPASQKQTS
jgi:site-specific recombinase XerD